MRWTDRRGKRLYGMDVLLIVSMVLFLVAFFPVHPAQDGELFGSQPVRITRVGPVLAQSGFAGFHDPEALLQLLSLPVSLQGTVHGRKVLQADGNIRMFRQ